MRNRNIRTAVILLALFVTTRAADGQNQLWVVDDDPGPGVDFPDIQEAVDAASDGDVVLVKDGTYSRFRIIGKGISVFAEKGANVEVVAFSPAHLAAVFIWQLAPEQTVVLRGLSIARGEQGSPAGVSVGHGVLIWDASGTVWVEDCRVRSDGAYGALGATNAESVVVVRSQLENRLNVHPFFSTSLSNDVGLQLSDSNIHLYDSIVIGGSGDSVAGLLEDCSIGLDGAPAAKLYSGRLFAAGSVFLGGDGSDSAVPGPSDNPGPATDGGDAIVLDSPSARVELVDSQLVPGVGGTATNPACTDGVDGAPLQLGLGTVELQPGAAPSVEIESPVRTDTPFEHTLQGPPGNFVAVAYSLTPHESAVPGFFGPLLVGAPPSVVPFGLFPGNGQLVTPATTGSLDGSEFVVLFAQPGTLTPAGTGSGVLHLGAPSAVLVLEGQE